MAARFFLFFVIIGLGFKAEGAEGLCPDQYSYNQATGKCEADPICPTDGSYHYSYHTCVGSDSVYLCPAGYDYVPSNHRCEAAISCPAGGSFNGQLNTCVSGTMPECCAPNCKPGYGYKCWDQQSSNWLCCGTPVCPPGGTWSFDYPNDCCAIGYTCRSPYGKWSYYERPCIVTPTCPNGGIFSAGDNKCLTMPYAEPYNDDCTALVGKPVSLASGKVMSSETDFHIPGLVEVQFTRYYSSKASLLRSLGPKWSHSFEPQVSPLSFNRYKVTNPDGGVYYYNDTNGDNVYEADIPRGETSSLLKNQDGTFTRVFKDGKREEFNAAGHLIAVGDKNGNRLALTRDSGNKLIRITDPAGRQINITYLLYSISQITLPDQGTITYTYNGSMLQKVTYPDGRYKTYEYSGTNLTGIRNENGAYIEKHTYDGQGRAATSSADGINDFLSISYLSENQATVTDSLGRTTTYSISREGGKSHATSISGPGCRECGQGDVSYTYDDNLNITSMTDASGNVTLMTYDSKGNMLTRTEGYGTQLQRTTVYTYNDLGQVTNVTDPDGNITTSTYDANGNLLTVMDAEGNVTSYGYDSRGLRTSMADPRGHVTTYSYDQYGNLTAVTDPLDHTITYTRDIMGRVLSMADANNQTTTYEYDLRGRLKKVTAPDSGITSYEYDPAGNLTAVNDPMGNRTTNTYDSIGRLTKVTDPEDSTISYAYDTQSNKTSMTIKDSADTAMTSESYTYDDHNRIWKTTHPDGTYTEQTYDANGNLRAKKDENGNIYTYSYDALNRLSTVTDPMNGVTSYAYDSRNNLRTVTDADGNTTTYTYDDANRLSSTISPDTGTTAYFYDASDNLLAKTDATGITVTYTYDLLNRLTAIQFPDPTQNITYTYDNCSNGKGRICSMVDPSGTTSYEYNTKGQIVNETKIIDNVTYITEYGYDGNGNQTSVTYPGGRVVTYTYGSNKARGVLNNGDPIAANISYVPFKGMTALTYGNGLIQITGYDSRYRISSVSNGGLQSLTYTYDGSGNITGITNNLDPTKNKTYGYDPLNRLSTAAGPWGLISYTYDNVGNRQTETTHLGLTNYAYTSNRLAFTTGEKIFSFTYDLNGNTISENTRQYIYNQNQRLIRAAEGQTVLGEYVYNGNGQRVKKTTASGQTVFHYDLQGKILAESTPAGTITSEYVFLNNSPFAKIESNNVYYYHNDHLGTPQKMTDSSGLITWEGEFLPFGEPLTITGTITNNLRFPGQYYDEETGLHYNYFRDYKPVVGRYVEADPIGVKKGKNHLYAYVGGNPIKTVDIKGLVGCGPFGIHWSDPWGLKGCCNDHDRCYNKCKSKCECDVEFCKCLMKKCDLFDPFSGQRDECLGRVGFYCNMVIMFGGIAYFPSCGSLGW